MKKFLLAATCMSISAALTFSAQAATSSKGSAVKATAVYEGPDLTCADFQHHSDGTWSVTRQDSVKFPDGEGIVTIAPDTKFAADGSYLGMPFKRVLDEKCGYPADVPFN
jgi:hypothetical protein